VNRRYARSRCDTDHDAVRPRMGNSAPKSVVRQSLSFCCWHVHGFSYVATVSSLGPLSGDRLVRRPADSSPGWRRARMAVFRARGSWRLDLRVAGCFGQQILTTIAARPAPTQLPAGHAPGPVRSCGRSWESPAGPGVWLSLCLTPVHSGPRATAGPPVRAGQGCRRPVMDGSQTGQAAGVGLTVAGCPLPCPAAKGE
jgi:hypothetical protein